jgi:hypothetical protein
MTGRAPDRSLGGRRNFCRIDDEVLLSFRLLRDKESSGEMAADRPDASSDTFTLLSQVALQRENVRGLLRALRSESPRILRCISAIEERLELLESWVLLNRLAACSDQPQTVRLSAGGMSFRTGSRLRADSLLALEIVLLPSLTGILSRGRVLRSVRQLGGDGSLPYLTAIEFIDMKESTRDLITRHILAQEGRRRRRDRHEQRPRGT